MTGSGWTTPTGRRSTPERRRRGGRGQRPVEPEGAPNSVPPACPPARRQRRPGCGQSALAAVPRRPRLCRYRPRRSDRPAPPASAPEHRRTAAQEHRRTGLPVIAGQRRRRWNGEGRRHRGPSANECNRPSSRACSAASAWPVAEPLTPETAARARLLQRHHSLAGGQPCRSSASTSPVISRPKCSPTRAPRPVACRPRPANGATAPPANPPTADAPRSAASRPCRRPVEFWYACVARLTPASSPASNRPP